MSKKLISIITVLVMLFSVMTMSFSAGAIFESDVAYGDIDNDGVVDTDDARLALMAAAGLKTITDEDTINRADVNNDGVVSVFDARQILRGVAGLVLLQPSGAFSGFTGYSDDTISITSPEEAIEVFNGCLNRIKLYDPGFTRSGETAVTDFNIQEITLVGINLGSSTESVVQMIKDMIVTEAEPEEAQVIEKGTDTTNEISVEGESYVSNLSADDVFGVEVSCDSEGLMTIKVALPDSEIENISQTAYADVFNTDLIKENSESILESVFAADTLDEAKRKNVKNAVATLVVDTATGNVVSYTTTYETSLYLVNSKIGITSILSAELVGVEYGTRVTVTYDDFQW